VGDRRRSRVGPAERRSGSGILSALLFAQGRLAPLRLDWQRATFHPLVSKATIEEVMRALTYPRFKLTAGDQQELLADYLPYCTAIAMPARPPRTPPCRDPFDVPFLELAIVGKADYLVTGDKDVISLAGRIRCRIVTAEQFLTSFDKK
jgi:putative PIN family toxin of toxin-antitoxin system